MFDKYYELIMRTGRQHPRLRYLLVLPLALVFAGAWVQETVSKARGLTLKQVATVAMCACMIFVMTPALPGGGAAATTGSPIGNSHSHEGWQAVSMGTTYIKIGDTEQSSNTLTAGNYYLDSDLSLSSPLYIGDGNYSSGMVNLCLNGHSITNSTESTNYNGAGIYMNRYSKLTITDCPDISETVGTIQGSSYGIYISNNASLYIKAGNISGETYGLYNHNPYYNQIYLSGTPSITGGTASIYNNSSSSKIYANYGEVEYTGDSVSLEYSYLSCGNTAVYNVSSGNQANFSLANETDKYELAYVDTSLEIQGEPQTLTWYDEDETLLTGENYPAFASYDSSIPSSDLPTPPNKDDGRIFVGWYYRYSGSTTWYSDHYSGSPIYGPIEFKAHYAQSVTLKWFQQDGNNEYSDAEYPISSYVGGKIDSLPRPSLSSHRFNGWLYRYSDESDWSNDYWESSSLLERDMQFKADFSQLYNITASSCENGYFSVSGSAAENDTVTVNVIADNGYAVDKITVTTQLGNTVPVFGSQFTMPAEPVTVSVTFREALKSGAGGDGPRVYETSNGDVFLGGDYIELGLRPSGVFGTKDRAPTTGNIIFHPRPSSSYSSGAIGLRSNGNQKWSAGLATGNDETVDFFLPGTIDEGWLVGWSEAQSVSASVKGRAQAAGSSHSDTVSSGNNISVTISGEAGKEIITADTTATVSNQVRVNQSVSFGVNEKYFTTSVTLTNNNNDTLYDLSYIRAFDPDQRSGVNGEDPDTDNYFYKDGLGNVWVVAFGNNSLNKGSSPTDVSFPDMITDNESAITPFVFCAKAPESSAGYTVQAVDTRVGWNDYSDFYRGRSSYPPYYSGEELYGKHYYADKGIGLEFIAPSLGAGESITFSWISSLDSNVLSTIENVRDEVGQVDPPVISNEGIELSLSAEVNADSGRNDINVSAKATDKAGMDNILYYSYMLQSGGAESTKQRLATVTADGTEKHLSGTISLKDMAAGTYTFYFWVGNSDGVTSDKIAKTIIINDDNSVTGDISIPAAHVHNWSNSWSQNSTHHWHECTAAGCDLTDNSQKQSYGAHVYDSNADTDCNTCGYTRTIASDDYTVNGDVKNNDNSVAADVTVKLKKGNKVIATTTTDSNGQYAFHAPSGVYNIVAEKAGVTMTVLVTVGNSDVTVDTITMPDGAINSILNVTGDNTPDISVGGLDKEALAVKNSDGNSATTVTVTMSVESRTESSADNANAIKGVASGKNLEYLDIKVEKQINETNAVPMSTTTTLMEIVIPFDKTGKSDITVYRYHDGSASAMEPNPSGGQEGYTVGDTTITIYAKKFSTYAIGYTEDSGASDPPGRPTGPSVPAPQKPTINADEGADVTLSADGITAEIKVKDGYELEDVTVNGISKGKVTKLTDLKTGDKIVVTTKKALTASDAARIEQAQSTKLVARSRITKLHGKTAVKVYWYAENGEDISKIYDGYVVYRSTQRRSGYGTKPFFETTNTSYINNLDLEKGNRYHYKVYGYVEVNGQRYYSDQSLKAWRTIR